MRENEPAFYFMMVTVQVEVAAAPAGGIWQDRKGQVRQTSMFTEWDVGQGDSRRFQEGV